MATGSRTTAAHPQKAADVGAQERRKGHSSKSTAVRDRAIQTSEEHGGKRQLRTRVNDAKFVSAYLRTGNATEAYQEMRGHEGSRTAARTKGKLRLRRPRVQKAIAHALLKIDMSNEEMLAELAAQIRTRSTDFLDTNGDLLPPARWPAHAAAALHGFDVVRGNVIGGDGHGDVIHKLRLHNKRDAIELLAKLRGLLTKRLKVETDERLLALLDEGRRRNSQRKRDDDEA